ncbi:hypothetical protein QMK33_21900 [Hymenobacter sp. H14-R3]|uniref:hypothetical protein n=1 Tax=Hymenobacter sp. H14-R3 TaxID=3046308 RepID=UPI0024B8C81D|nr:hypothetical protein [Hymenobacter sp. H14-R3]MDJ0367809.1 hypothetical protein [Hymenobacter sp. H14-R3]
MVYRTFADTHLSASAPELAYLYGAYAHDRQHGTAEASSFTDGLRLHRLFDQLAQTSGDFF